MTGVELIAGERAGHAGHGYDDAHDDTHVNGEIGQAALVVLQELLDGESPCVEPDDDLDWIAVTALTARTRSDVRRLVIAGSLLAAEIDRRLRAGDVV